MWKEGGHKSWVVTVNYHHAKIFSKIAKDKNVSVELVQELQAELDSTHETPGRTFNRVGYARHKIEPHTDRRDVENKDFATKIVQILQEAKKQNRFESFILIAPPKMMPILEKMLDKNLENLLSQKIAKNMVNLEANEIKDRVKKYCGPKFFAA
jgi:protein required for attachment to host cells